MDKILPHNLDIERVVLGTLMTDRNAYQDTSGILCPDCFYSEFHKKIFNSVKAISDRGDRPDSISVYNELLKSDDTTSAYEISSISVCHTFDYTQHAYYLKEKMIRRKLFELSGYLNSSCFTEGEDVEEAITKASEGLSNLLLDSQSTVSTIQDGFEEVCKNIDRNLSGQSEITGFQTGFRYFDKKSGGLQKSNLIIIAGETSQGKTSFALSVLRNIVRRDVSCAIYSLEMNLLEISSRFISMESSIASNNILYSRLQEYQIEMIDKSIGVLQNKRIFIDENSTSSLDSILSSIRFLKIKYDIQVVVVDFIQLVSVKGINGNKEQQTAYLVRRLKNAAKELDICIIALSQLNRDHANPHPTLNRLRDSGQIAEAADVVMFVYRPEYYGKFFPSPFEDKETKGMAMIEVAKGRNIGVFKFLCRFNAETTHFIDIDDWDIPRRNEIVKEINIPF